MMTETANRSASLLQEEAVRVGTTALATVPGEMRWLDVPRDEMARTLRQSLYPGASDEMILAVMDYCRAAGLNVMLRPVHIVPMFIPTKKAMRDGKEVVVEGTGMMRDVIMPGINHYRVQATRTGRYVGLSRPEWGPTRKFTFKGGATLEIPESVAMCARVKVDGEIVEFWHEERFLEAYATAGRDTDMPNAMWFKRPTGQLAKVGEAGALRKAFPELGDYTAEEMEGKTIDLVRQPDGSHAAPPPKPENAAGQLDSFTGGGAVKGGGKAQARAKPKAGADDAGQGGAQQGAAEQASKVADQLPTEDTGEVPKMPDEAFADFSERGKWSKAWRLLNETMPKLGPNDRQSLADEYATILRAVHASSPNYRKAAEDFAERMMVAVRSQKVEE